MTDGDGDRRVVFVTQEYPPDKGGNAARVGDLATNLSDGEWDVTVLAPPPCYPPGEFDRSWRRKRTEAVDGVVVHRLWSWQPQTEDPGTASRLAYYLLFGVHAILWMLRNWRRYDAVVTTTPPISTGAPGLVAAGLGKPWVVDVRDLWIDASIALGYLEADSALERVSRRFQRLVLHQADRVAVTTETLGESIRQTYGRSLGAKTTVVPNGVDAERFRPDAGRGTASQGPTGGPVETDGGAGAPGEGGSSSSRETDGGDGPTIIYTGNLGTAQDLESFVRAASHLSHEDATLRLVGRGDVESKLRRLTSELELHDRVEFDGLVSREAVPALLSEATVGIAPLRDSPELAYAMPTKVYEYMACGLPTIVTGRGEIRRFVAASGGGVHVANDPERIAEAIDELLEDDALRDRLAEQGRDHVSSEYDRGAIARRLGDELDRLVADGVESPS